MFRVGRDDIINGANSKFDRRREIRASITIRSIETEVEAYSLELNQFLELFPGLIFLVAYFIFDIYIATVALMVAVVVQFAAFKIFKRPITKMMWVVLFGALIFGTLTIVLQNPLFIKWKPTVVSWIFGVVLIGNLFVGRRNVLQMFIGDQVKLPDANWRHQSLILGVGTFVSGAVNLLVAYNFSEPTWVSYRFASIFIWPVVFAIVLTIYFLLINRKSDEN